MPPEISFKDFQKLTIAIVKGEHVPGPRAPKVWKEPAKRTAKRASAKKKPSRG